MQRRENQPPGFSLVFWREVAWLRRRPLLVLAAGMASIIWFAYATRVRIEPASVAVQQRATSREIGRANDLECLAENIYFEARGEPLRGQYAVAEVTLNRTHAANFPRTVCGVVHEARWDARQRRSTQRICARKD